MREITRDEAEAIIARDGLRAELGVLSSVLDYFDDQGRSRVQFVADTWRWYYRDGPLADAVWTPLEESEGRLEQNQYGDMRSRQVS